jgi:ABC-type enterochelin transport system permease subunit
MDKATHILETKKRPELLLGAFQIQGIILDGGQVLFLKVFKQKRLSGCCAVWLFTCLE